MAEDNHRILLGEFITSGQYLKVHGPNVIRKLYNKNHNTRASAQGSTGHCRIRWIPSHGTLTSPLRFATFFTGLIAILRDGIKQKKIKGFFSDSVLDLFEYFCEIEAALPGTAKDVKKLAFQGHGFLHYLLRIKSLRSVRTSLGKGRAFVLHCLNSGVFCDYLFTLTDHEILLKHHHSSALLASATHVSTLIEALQDVQNSLKFQVNLEDSSLDYVPPNPNQALQSQPPSTPSTPTPSKTVHSASTPDVTALAAPELEGAGEVRVLRKRLQEAESDAARLSSDKARAEASLLATENELLTATGLSRQFSEEVEQLQSQLQSKRNEHIAASQRVEELESRVSELDDSVTELTVQVNQGTVALAESEKEVAGVRQTLQEARAKLDNDKELSRVDQNSLEASVKELQQSLQACERDNENLKRMHASVEAELETVSAARDQDRHDFDTQRKQLRSELSGMNKEASEENKSRELQLTSEVDRLEALVTQLKSEAGSQARLVADITTKLDTAEQLSRDTKSDLEKSELALSKASIERDEMKSSNVTLSNKLAQFESDLSASTNKAETLQKRLTVAEEETNALRHESQKERSDHKAEKGALQKSNEQMKVEILALQETLAQRNEDCIVKEQDRVRALEKADAVENERSLAVAALSAAEDNIRVMKSDMSTLQLRESEAQQKADTALEDLKKSTDSSLALDISLAAAVVAKKKAESISAEAQTRLQALERDIAAHEAATDKANNALLLAEQGRAEAVRQSEVATQKANERASTLEIVESNLVVAQESIENEKQLVESLRKKNSVLEASLQTSETTVSELDTKLSTIQLANSALQQDMSRFESEAGAANKRIGLAEDKAASEAARAEEAESRITALSATAAEQSRTIADLEAAAAEYQARIESLESEQVKTRASVKQTAAAVAASHAKELASVTMSLNEKITAQESTVEHLSSDLKNTQQTLCDAKLSHSKEVVSLKDDIFRSEGRATEAKNKMIESENTLYETQVELQRLEQRMSQISHSTEPALTTISVLFGGVSVQTFISPQSRERPLLTSWLVKRGMHGKWGRRFFILRPPYLIHFRTDEPKETARGALMVPGMTAKIVNNIAKRSNCFTITPSGDKAEEFLLQAESEESRDEWLRALRIAKGLSFADTI